MSWEWKEMKYNYNILFSLMSVYLSLSDQLFGDLSDILRKHDSQKLAIITGVDKKKINDK